MIYTFQPMLFLRSCNIYIYVVYKGLSFISLKAEWLIYIYVNILLRVYIYIYIYHILTYVRYIYYIYYNVFKVM